MICKVVRKKEPAKARALPATTLAAVRAELPQIIQGVPDKSSPALINYWLDRGDYKVYIEGWSDQCLQGTGFPKMEGGETENKIVYMQDLTPGILKRKAKEQGLEMIDGSFVELPDRTNLYGVTYGIYKKQRGK